MSLASVRRDDFAVHTGSQWRVRQHPGVTLRLIEVSPLATSGPWESFSLCFAGPSGVELGQGTHALEHDNLGTFELFLVPLEPGAEGSRYECIFTRDASGTTAAGG
jgi:hypothetical protein